MFIRNYRFILGAFLVCFLFALFLVFDLSATGKEDIAAIISKSKNNPFAVCEDEDLCNEDLPPDISLSVGPNYYSFSTAFNKSKCDASRRKVTFYDDLCDGVPESKHVDQKELVRSISGDDKREYATILREILLFVDAMEGYKVGSKQISDTGSRPTVSDNKASLEKILGLAEKTAATEQDRGRSTTGFYGDVISFRFITKHNGKTYTDCTIYESFELYTVFEAVDRDCDGHAVVSWDTTGKGHVKVSSSDAINAYAIALSGMEKLMHVAATVLPKRE